MKYTTPSMMPASRISSKTWKMPSSSPSASPDILRTCSPVLVSGRLSPQNARSDMVHTSRSMRTKRSLSRTLSMKMMRHTIRTRLTSPTSGSCAGTISSRVPTFRRPYLSSSVRWNWLPNWCIIFSTRSMKLHRKTSVCVNTSASCLHQKTNSWNTETCWHGSTTTASSISTISSACSSNSKSSPALHRASMKSSPIPSR